MVQLSRLFSVFYCIRGVVILFNTDLAVLHEVQNAFTGRKGLKKNKIDEGKRSEK